MTDEQMWNNDNDSAFTLAGIDRPAWVNDLTPYDIAAIYQGGCASGAYMPAVTYHTATQTMAEHGDDVLAFIADNYGELPKPDSEESWSGIAVFYLSIAVELMASLIYSELTDD